MKCTTDRFYNSGQCIQSCPDGWYGNTDTNSCMKCHDNCETCYGKSEHQCVKCAEGLIMVEGTCEFQCVDRINPSLCHNLHEFCDVKLVYRSCCASCTSLQSGPVEAVSHSSVSTGAGASSSAVGHDPSAPGIDKPAVASVVGDPTAPGGGQADSVAAAKKKYAL